MVKYETGLKKDNIIIKTLRNIFAFQNCIKVLSQSELIWILTVCGRENNVLMDGSFVTCLGGFYRVSVFTWVCCRYFTKQKLHQLCMFTKALCFWKKRNNAKVQGIPNDCIGLSHCRFKMYILHNVEHCV